MCPSARELRKDGELWSPYIPGQIILPLVFGGQRSPPVSHCAPTLIFNPPEKGTSPELESLLMVNIKLLRGLWPL